MNTYVFALICVAAVVTILIRFLPFMLLSHGSEVPGWVQYLGRILPPAVMSVLLVYCLRSIEFTVGSRGIPELAATAVVVLLHLWKRNTLLSICTGTVLYMILVQGVL